MKLFKKFNSCVYCGHKKLKKEKSQTIPINFYLKAIMSDLKLSKKDLNKMKIYKCVRCYCLQNNPWFNENVSRKIYSNIYGQHNRSWSNLIKFLKKGKKPEHGSLYEILEKNINIKNYAEFNSPFMGLMLNFFSSEYKNNLNFYNKILKGIINYLTSRQVAGKSKEKQKLSMQKSYSYRKEIDDLKNKFSKKKKIKKILFIDNSNLFWGQNDNYKSVSSKSFASEMLDLQILDLDKKNRKAKIDLFGIFHTLDHTFQPQKTLNFALDISKYVVVYCHVNEIIEKQHLFSISKDFLKYLNRQSIYTLNLTNMINKKYKSPELYFLCSKKKKYIDKFKI